MKPSPLFVTATLTLLMTSAPGSSQGAAKEEEVLMPETAVSGQAEVRRHPQDPTWSERELGCVEIITPNTGGGSGGSFQARFAKHGIPVIPNLNDPASASEMARRGPTYYQHRATPPGQAGKPGCQH